MLLACPQIFLSFLFSVYNRSITSVQDLWYDKRSQKCILLYDFTWWRIHVVNVGCCTNCFVPAKKNIMMQPDRQIKSIPIFSSLIFCICWGFLQCILLEYWGRGWVTLIETWLNYRIFGLTPSEVWVHISSWANNPQRWRNWVGCHFLKKV